jgi:hypothetical protein
MWDWNLAVLTLLCQHFYQLLNDERTTVKSDSTMEGNGWELST